MAEQTVAQVVYPHQLWHHPFLVLVTGRRARVGLVQQRHQIGHDVKVLECHQGLRRVVGRGRPRVTQRLKQDGSAFRDRTVHQCLDRRLASVGVKVEHRAPRQGRAGGLAVNGCQHLDQVEAHLVVFGLEHLSQ